jgi:hypothetical protein
MSSLYLVLGANVNHPLVEAWSSQRLPLEPEGWKKQMRDEVRQALRGLQSASDSNMAVLYISPTSAHCDVENIVFYNIGAGSFSHLGLWAIRLERVFSEPPTPPTNTIQGAQHYVSYALTEKHLFTYWDPISPRIAIWNNLPCGESCHSLKVSSVWYRLKSAICEDKVLLLSLPKAGEVNIGLRIIIHAPRGANLNLTSVIKPLFDGVMSAFSAHEDGADLVADRLAGILGLKETEVIRLLKSNAMAALGPRKLIWPRAHGVQWNPNDDLLVAGELSLAISDSETQWALSGELFYVKRR